MGLFLFKIWIFEIDFTTILSFLLGIFLGAIIVCMTYAFFVLASLRNKKFLIKTDEDTLTTTEVKSMILESQRCFKDKDLRGELSRVAHCKNLCTSLVYGIATRFYPTSKHPLLELSIDEAMMLTIYIEKRVEDLLNRKAIRLLKGIKISSIVEFTKMTNKVVDSKAFKFTKEVNSTLNTIKKIVNVVNPAWWFKKLVFDKTINVITNKLCLVVIAIVGEETYKIYSKTVFNEEVTIESNVDAILTSIDKDLIDASNEIKTNNQKDFDDDFNNLKIENAMSGYRLKSKALMGDSNYEFSSICNRAFPNLAKGQKESYGFAKFNEEE